MLVYKHRGFVSPDLNETLGIAKFEIISTGRNNTGTSSLTIDGNLITSLTRRGLTIIALNEDFTVYETNRFDTIQSDSDKDSMANYIRNRPSNKYFVILSYDSFDSNPNLASAMIQFGAIRFTEIPFDESYEMLDGNIYNTRIPYCAIAGSDVGIVYESLGSGVPNSSYPNAYLNVVVPDLKYLGCQGFGRNLCNITRYEGNRYKYFLVRPMDEPANQYYKFSYFYKVDNQTSSYDKGAWIRIDLVNGDNDKILDTVYNRFITSSQWKRDECYLPPLENGNKYRGSVVADGNSAINLDRMRIVKCGVSHPYFDDNHFGRITDKYTSALHLRNSYFGPEPYYGDSIEGGYLTSDKLFDDNINIPVYEYTDPKGKLIDGVYETPKVEIKDTYAGIIGNGILYGDNGFQPKVETTFYDINDNIISTTTHIDHTEDVISGKNLFLEWFAFKEEEVPNFLNYSRIQNIRFLSGNEEYGYSSTPQVNAVLEIPVDAVYISYRFSKNTDENYYIAYPCANTLVPMAGRKGYISPANFNMEPPKPPPQTALVFEDSLTLSFYTVDVGAPTPENIIAEWPRASNTTYWDDPNDATGQSADWFYDASSNSFSNSNNSGTYIQLLSPDKLQNFEFECIVTSTSGDNDSVGLVAAANDDGTDFETIIVACNGGHIGPAKGFSLYLMSTISGSQLLAQSLPFTSNGQGWSGRELRVRVIRDGNTIKAQASQWNSTTLREEYEISVDLSSITGTILTSPSRYGFFSYSQANAKFLQYQVSGGGVYDRRTIYDGETLETWYFGNDNKWAKTGESMTDDIIPPREVYNPLTKKTYTLNYSGTTLIENDGITGNTPTLTFPVNSSNTVSLSDLTAYFDYNGMNININSVVQQTDCTITLGSTNATIDTTGVDGEFYLYLETADGTIAFKRYIVEVT